MKRLSKARQDPPIPVVCGTVRTDNHQRTVLRAVESPTKPNEDPFFWNAKGMYLTAAGEKFIGPKSLTVRSDDFLRYPAIFKDLWRL